MNVVQAIAFALLVGLAVIGALELDRRLTGCGGLILVAGTRP